MQYHAFMHACMRECTLRIFGGSYHGLRLFLKSRSLGLSGFGFEDLGFGHMGLLSVPRFLASGL